MVTDVVADRPPALRHDHRARWSHESAPAIAQREVGEDGVWIEPADARAQISELKLGRLQRASECRRSAPDEPASRTLAALYALYERELRKDNCHDFDDQIFLAVRALRLDADLRARWQGRFDGVRVHEYQDIEPAQELLVQILAAPQDSLFVVGDPDQLLHGWRRASATRIVALDQIYPGLQRTALETDCPAQVVARSAQLIAPRTTRLLARSPRPASGRASGSAPRPRSSRSGARCKSSVRIYNWRLIGSSPSRRTCSA